MAIEIESGFSVRKSVLPILVLLISVAVLIFLVSSYVFLNISSQKISKDIEEKDKKLLETPEELALKKEVSVYQTNIENFKTLIDLHKKPGGIFSFLEEVCHPNIWFTGFNFTLDGNKVSVEGSAKDFIVLAQQLMILKQHKDVLTQITVSDINSGEEGEITFSLNLAFADQILNNNE